MEYDYLLDRRPEVFAQLVEGSHVVLEFPDGLKCIATVNSIEFNQSNFVLYLSGGRELVLNKDKFFTDRFTIDGVTYRV